MKNKYNCPERRMGIYAQAQPPCARQSFAEFAPHKPQIWRGWNVKIALAAVIMSVVSINCLRAQTEEEGAVRHTETAEAAAHSEGGVNSRRMTLIEFAIERQGIPYRSGGSTEKGFDCSGFVWFVYRNALNMDIPRSSRGLWSSDAETIQLEDALPGDVLVFSANKGGSGSINHTAILVDKDSIIHAVSSGPRRGVVISPITDKYFAPRLVGVKRFLPDD